MKKIILTENQYRLLLKEAKENVIYIPYDDEYGFDYQESNESYDEDESDDEDDDYYDYDEQESSIDQYQAVDDALKIAKETGVNILKDKNIKGILYDTNEKIVVGALWTSDDSDAFSFDIAITPSYQNQGLSSELISNAIEEYDIQKSAYDDMGKPFPMEVDVINPKLAQILTKHYGFKTLKKIDDTRVLMTINDQKDETVKCSNCGWEWKLKDGGSKPYLCHKCWHDNSKAELNERCWKGYTQKGMKTMFGKKYPNCVKKNK
jgi:GNAT superfamily N-acetyltransferase/DNA-directed RNA polymerase subunit RPC12/RpoP